MTTHYDTLGVGRNATPGIILSAWKEKRKLYHPDRNGIAQKEGRNDERTTFQGAKKAYEVLSDEEWRKAYDLTLPPETLTTPQGGFDFPKFLSEVIHTLAFIPLIFFC